MKTILGTKISKCVCAALSLVILCAVPLTGSAYSADEELGTQQTSEPKPASSNFLGETIESVEVGDITTLKKLGKIDDQLCEILEKAGDDELIPVSIWITDIDFEEVEKKVEAEFGLSRYIIEQRSDALFKDFVADASNGLYSTAALTALSEKEFIAAINDYKELNRSKVEQLDMDVETYTIEQRNIAKEMITKSNNAFVDAFLSDAEDIYVFGAFPIIDCSITKEKILYLSSLSIVESISSNASKDTVYPDWMVELSVEDSNPFVNEVGTMSASSATGTDKQIADAITNNIKAVNGDYTRDSLGFDGGRIKIGQIDVGVPDPSAAQLKNAKIERHGITDYKEHPTQVASIMVGKDGIAPEAQLYCTSFTGSTDSLRKCADTLILTDHVNIINMSARITDTSATTYNEAAKLADFAVYSYNVTWVCAVGNSGRSSSHFVESPAMAFNVIAVGAIDTKGDLNPSNDVISPYSSYITLGKMSQKPEVVAPGDYYISSSEVWTGTSFAAPVVAGLAAQLMSFSSEMILKPEAIKAAIIASCDHKTPDITGSAYIDYKEGTGVVDALNAANSLSLMKLQNTYYTTTDSSKEFTLYPITDGIKSVSISWLKKNTGTLAKPVEGPLANFDLFVYYTDTANYPSRSSSNGYEYVCFNASKSKTYKIQITKTGSSGTSERIALAINR